MPLKQKLYCTTLGCKMAHAVKGILRMLKERFSAEDINLTLEQYFILNILDNEEGLILQDLAEIVHRDKSAVMRHISGLEKKHFVARATDPEDKRRKILLVTKRGINELEKARALAEQVNSDIIRDIPEEKLSELEEILDDIYEFTMSDELY